MELLIQFLNDNYYMLVPALWVLGYALKQTPRIPDWSIIWIVLGCSLGFSAVAFGLSFEGVLNGIIAAGIAVLGHQMLKQTLSARTEKKEIIIKKEEDTKKDSKG